MRLGMHIASKHVGREWFESLDTTCKWISFQQNLACIFQYSADGSKGVEMNSKGRSSRGIVQPYQSAINKNDTSSCSNLQCAHDDTVWLSKSRRNPFAKFLTPLSHGNIYWTSHQQIFIWYWLLDLSHSESGFTMGFPDANYHKEVLVHGSVKIRIGKIQYVPTLKELLMTTCKISSVGQDVYNWVRTVSA